MIVNENLFGLYHIEVTHVYKLDMTIITNVNTSFFFFGTGEAAGWPTNRLVSHSVMSVHKVIGETKTKVFHVS